MTTALLTTDKSFLCVLYKIHVHIRVLGKQSHCCGSANMTENVANAGFVSLKYLIGIDGETMNRDRVMIFGYLKNYKKFKKFAYLLVHLKKLYFPPIWCITSW